MNQKRGWMKDLFLMWYDSYFIPKAKKFQEEIHKDGNILLILYNAPSHPSSGSLEQENGKMESSFFSYHQM
jgi:hypothetical protein